MEITIPMLQRGLIFFWALWLTVVTISNLLDGLKALRILPESWRFASGNYAAIRSALGERSPAALAGALFAGAILWEALAALLFWRAFSTLDIIPAFAISLALWAAFVVMDELLVEFELAASHLRIFTAQLATLIAIILLPTFNLL